MHFQDHRSGYLRLWYRHHSPYFVFALLLIPSGQSVAAMASTRATHTQIIRDGTIDRIHLLEPIAWYLRWDVLPFFVTYVGLFSILLSANLFSTQYTGPSIGIGTDRWVAVG